MRSEPWWPLLQVGTLRCNVVSVMLKGVRGGETALREWTGECGGDCRLEGIVIVTPHVTRGSL